MLHAGHPGSATTRPATASTTTATASSDEDFAAGPATCGVGACARNGTHACVGRNVADSCTRRAPGRERRDLQRRRRRLRRRNRRELRAGHACGIGACAALRRALSCVDGAERRHAAGAPAANDASCNGIDDDCDGTTDEDFVPVVRQLRHRRCARSGVPRVRRRYSRQRQLRAGFHDRPERRESATASTTTATDTDEGYAPVIRSCGMGACASSAATACVGGAVTGGVCTPGSATGDDSVCNGIDDDCDEHIDESYLPVLTQCGVGVCASSAITACAAGAVIGGVCVPGSATGNDSVCNGIDDDCDGHTDESYAPVTTTCGVGACASSATTSCVGGSVTGGVCTPGPTTGNDSDCDGIDDDCDSHTRQSYAPVATSCQVNGCQATGTLVCTSGSTVNTCLTAPHCTAGIACADHADNDSDSLVDCVTGLQRVGVLRAADGRPGGRRQGRHLGAGHPSVPPFDRPGQLPPLVPLNYGANAVVTINASGLVHEWTRAPSVPMARAQPGQCRARPASPATITRHSRAG